MIAPENLDIQLSGILPIDSKEYFRYIGSFSKPVCDEGVIWTVFKQKINISIEQVRDLKFMDLFYFCF